jgi:hypothetical protein
MATLEGSATSAFNNNTTTMEMDVDMDLDLTVDAPEEHLSNVYPEVCSSASTCSLG